MKQETDSIKITEWKRSTIWASLPFVKGSRVSKTVLLKSKPWCPPRAKRRLWGRWTRKWGRRRGRGYNFRQTWIVNRWMTRQKKNWVLRREPSSALFLVLKKETVTTVTLIKCQTAPTLIILVRRVKRKSN